MIHHLLKTEYCIPDFHVDTIQTIDFKARYEEGTRLLLIDLDNTLVPYDESMPNETLMAFLNDIKKIGFELVIISNNHRKRIRMFCDAVGIPYVSSAKKPFRCGFKKALKRVEKDYSEDRILVIGDQLMTDVYGAKRMRYRVVLVKPIKKKSEKWYTKFNRWLERKMLKKIQKKYPEIYDKLQLETR